jgi:hypothetical protein
MHKYKPRRASKRWLANAPDYVLDVFDDPRTIDRYTVFFCGELLIGDSRQNMYIPYLGMSGAPTHPQGFSQWGELRPHEVSAYRYRNSHKRIKWLQLPENIRRHVIMRATE